ncbi:hypothetical protein BDP27DRAFT_1033723 [Rhodocollybia butyracea]|uniref:Uncharacterized protein n=1 Tax=Rhodocollybia butyracea TaxID=206335 RepID=A0A9P5Q6E4_9AGAR|nr:hypothetical protein BDP27DRAFT_1033723 [Rhodocollybia butyracea]
MENGEPFFSKEVKLLTLACRFVPYDQWLVTHVDSSWTIHEVKSWILAKCIASNTFGHTTESPNLPIISPPAKPKTKPSRRPASPIVFAEFSPSEGGPTHGTRYESDRPAKEEKLKGTSRKRRARGRPISPITFAPIGVPDVDTGGEDDPLKRRYG